MVDTSESGNLRELLDQLWNLTAAYFKQETLAPLKVLRRFVQFGVMGSGLLAVGFILLSVALLRALQVETYPHWTGDWSWVPYVLTLAGSLLVALLLGLMINVDRRRAARRKSTRA